MDGKDRRITRRKALQAGGALGGGLLLAACAGPAAAPVGPAGPAAPQLTAAEVEAAARKEGGQILWYTSGNVALSDAVKAAFSKEFPWTKLDVASIPLTTLPAKIVTEAVTQVPTADVIWIPPTYRQLMLRNNVPAKISLNNDSLMPKDLLDPDGYAHPAWSLLVSLVYNPNVVKTPPTDPLDLAKPEWKDKIAFDKVLNLGQSTTWLSAWRKGWGDEKWGKWLDGVAANNVFITNTAADSYSAVLRGERAIGISSSNYILSQAKGTPMEFSYAVSPLPFLSHQYLTKRAEHPAMGRFFMEWMSSEPGQRIIASSGLSPIMTLDVPNAQKNFVPAGTKVMPGTELADFATRTDDYVKQLSARWRG